MIQISASTSIRLARPSADLAVAEAFWVGGVGLDILWRTDDPPAGEHALLMVGPQDAGWHLELVDDPEAAEASRPGPEDLLVLYLGERPDRAWLAAIAEAGGEVVPARNPYWDTWGVTIRDPDGYLLVLSHRTWA